MEKSITPTTDKAIPYDEKTKESTENGSVLLAIDASAEKSYLRKLDMYLLPYLSLMYFFNAIDRSNLGNAKTDGMDVDMNFVGNQYSLLILLFYVPFGLMDLPLNLLTKRFSGKIMLPTLMVGWGSMATIQAAAVNFGGMLALRLLLACFEAGFYCGVVFYLTLFYTRGELAFRIAIFFGSALLAAAFSGLLSYGVFQIDHPTIHGWQWLFIIEGLLTVIFGVIAYFWLPAHPETAWFLNDRERAGARARALRDSSRKVNTAFSFKAAFETWKSWNFALWMLICFTYPVAFATTSNFLPQIVQRLGYSVIKTNLWTVAPNATGFVVLLCVSKSSDYFRERTFHIIGALSLSLVGMVILAAIDALNNKGVAYFACFLMASGAYIPSVLVHSWHNNNDLDETSRAARTGLLVGLGNLGGIISGATFRVEYAPSYWPTLVATACCNGVCIISVLTMGLWMRRENARRNKAQGRVLKAEDVDTDTLQDGENSPDWRYFI
ncbi:hypothetical protein PV10_01479 [Exophiala mesophila]|uniref:Major facilitator superfamily (MFS) profile domain-containing protein n=1 Tax=Exophiala mesophila TaxID=212818 RepID=A0A0D1YAU9_EXOME|nr:uncharacterized protein PV10_01479 [Exophiala mesophila]KIV97771.1 hypothetical protein PV10_01479 [Exophiala mesophila]